jgi:hypothetical protein
MNARLLTIVLGVGVVFSALALVPRLMATRMPGDHRGYEPVQPIEYSHRLHAGELGIPCLYCHSGAERSRHAGIPAASTCMNCHRFVKAKRATVRAEEELAKSEGRKPRLVVAPEIEKLERAVKRNTPIRWARIHRLPDFVYFDHRPHVAAGLACQKCHGPIETMERVRQVESLNMGWCVNCHRGRSGPVRVKASTDCSVCHI